MPGPPKKPTAQLAPDSWRRGERSLEPDAPVEAPDCPEWLTGPARIEWTRIVPDLLTRRTLSKADRGTLAGMCFWWGEFVKAQAKVAKLRGAFKGHPIDHPRVLLSQSWKEYSKAAQQFGLSPASKARVQASAPDKPANSKSRFFNGPRLANTA